MDLWLIGVACGLVAAWAWPRGWDEEPGDEEPDGGPTDAASRAARVAPSAGEGGWVRIVRAPQGVSGGDRR